MSLTSGNAEMQENSDSDDENDDDIPLANLFNIRNRLDQIGFTTVDLVNVDSELYLRYLEECQILQQHPFSAHFPSQHIE
jgi:hypothetical protein